LGTFPCCLLTNIAAFHSSDAPNTSNDQVAPPLTGSNRVNGSGGALCLTALRGAYRRVSQSRICTAVYSLAQRSQWGLRPLLREKCTASCLPH